MGESKKNVAMALERWCRKTFGETICCHVKSWARNEFDGAVADVFTKGMHARVDVLGSTLIGGMFGNHNAGLVVFVERCWFMLRKMYGGEEAAEPQDFVACVAG